MLNKMSFHNTSSEWSMWPLIRRATITVVRPLPHTPWRAATDEYHKAGNYNPIRITELIRSMTSLEVLSLDLEHLQVPHNRGFQLNVRSCMGNMKWPFEHLRLAAPNHVCYDIISNFGFDSLKSLQLYAEVKSDTYKAAKIFPELQRLQVQVHEERNKAGTVMYNQALNSIVDDFCYLQCLIIRTDEGNPDGLTLSWHYTV
ncbi:hypothetical protein B0T10DRAFT_555018 [Thelonectria olida]|uniref:Uncharacterized protein n=1 Tax=Thelonectria olida TaxID=1576542 RepID=A0A9P9AU25_9HYPO|nr:hypothetical protein B0T10DRAFT_555018 [Thelonectria olida]